MSGDRDGRESLEIRRGSSASEGEERVLVATAPQLRDLYRGYEVSLGEGSYPTIVYNLPEGKTWRKSIWPRAAFPRLLQRWNIPEEIFSYLISFDGHKQWISRDVPNRPPSGTLLMYDRRKTENYRSDGYDWKTRGKSRSVREDRMKLKVKGCELLYGCYTHSESNVKLHRRSYWLLQNPSIIIIHYLEVEGTKKASSVNCPVVSTTSVEQPIGGIQEGVEPVDLGLLTVSDKNLCHYLSLSQDFDHFRRLLHQLSVAVNQTEQTFADISAAITHNNRHISPDFSFTSDQQKEKTSFVPPSSGLNGVSELLVRQAIEVMGAQAVSLMQGHQPLLPKGGTGFVPPSLLFKVASHIATANKHRLASSYSQPNQSQGLCHHQQPRATVCTSSPSHVVDDLQPLAPLSAESLQKVIPSLEPLDTAPAVPHKINDARKVSTGDFDSEKFCKFVRSLAVLDPLRDIPAQSTTSPQNLPDSTDGVSGGESMEGVFSSQGEHATLNQSRTAGACGMETQEDLVSDNLVEQLFMQELLSSQPSSLAHTSPSDLLSHYSLSSAQVDAQVGGGSVSYSDSGQSPSQCSPQPLQRNNFEPQPIYSMQVPIPADPNFLQPSNNIAPVSSKETGVASATELGSGRVADLSSLDLALDEDTLMQLLTSSESMAPMTSCSIGFGPSSALDDHGEYFRDSERMSEGLDRELDSQVPAVPPLQRKCSLLNGPAGPVLAPQQQSDLDHSLDGFLSPAPGHPDRYPAVSDGGIVMGDPRAAHLVTSHNWAGEVVDADSLTGMFPHARMPPLHDFDHLLSGKGLPVAMDNNGESSLLTCEERTHRMPGLPTNCSSLYHDSVAFPTSRDPSDEFDPEEERMESGGAILLSFPPASQSAIDHHFANSFLNSPQLVTGEAGYAPTSAPQLAQNVSLTEPNASQMLPTTSPATTTTTTTLEPIFLSPSTISPAGDYWTSSSIPSSPSVASVSSLGGTGGGDNFDYSDPPSVAELCELLSESPSVQQEDFRHLSLSDSEQQELIEASRVIQNTLRRHRDRSHLTQDKHAAFLIENCYRQCKELKDQRDWAARRIQNQYRLYRRRNQELQRAVLFIQQMYRYQRNRRLHGRTQSFHFSAHSSLEARPSTKNRMV